MSGRHLRRDAPVLSELLGACSDHWGSDDPVYRFYHQSFEVFGLQESTRAIVELLERLAPPGCPLNPWLREIVAQGTGRRFPPEDNADGLAPTRPVLEAFFHVRWLLETAVRYSTLVSRRVRSRAAAPPSWTSMACGDPSE